MCNKAVFSQLYVSSVCICASDVQFCVACVLCQSAVSISILYRGLAVLSVQHHGCTQCLRAHFAKMTARKNISLPT